MTLYIYRPIQKKDLNDVLELVMQTQSGLTSLPKDTHFLNKKIEAAITSLKRKDKKIDHQSYLFVLEDVQHKKVIGMSGIKASVGVKSPFYSYRIKTLDRESKQLKIKREVRLMHVRKVVSGPSEIGSLLLHKKYRKQGLGQLLSLNRFLFMAAHPKRFKSKIIAEMRGISDQDGQSPFWNAIGYRFIKMNFKSADRLSAEDKTFIQELFPRYPIYVDCLPLCAQKVIGHCHVKTRPALNILKKQGFEWHQDIDIFDGGPKIEVKKKDIKIIKQSQKVKVIGITNQPDQSVYVANQEVERFRAMRVQVSWETKKTIRCTKSILDYLKIKIGDTVIISGMEKE